MTSWRIYSMPAKKEFRSDVTNWFQQQGVSLWPDTLGSLRLRAYSDEGVGRFRTKLSTHSRDALHPSERSDAGS